MADDGTRVLSEMALLQEMELPALTMSMMTAETQMRVAAVVGVVPALGV